MKLRNRMFSFLMAFTFLMATTGFSVYEHYCSGNLVDLSIYTSEKNCDPESEKGCTTSKKMDCCEDHVQFVKLEVDLQKSENHSEGIFQYALIHLTYIAIQEPQNNQLQFNNSYLPPIGNQSPFYIQNHQLIFYS